MGRRPVDGLREGRGRSVATAVVGRAQVRAALDDLARNPDLGLGGIDAGLPVRTARVGRDAARVLRGVGMSGCVPVCRPLPHVADHVDQVEPLDGNDPTGEVRSQPSSRSLRQGNVPCPLPRVGHRSTVGRQLVRLTRTRRRPVLRVRRAPTRPRSATVYLPRWRTRGRRRTTRVRPDDHRAGEWWCPGRWDVVSRRPSRTSTSCRCRAGRPDLEASRRCCSSPV